MFDYQEYKQMIDIIKKSGKQKSFFEALNASKYVIVRHDVEFSVERAYNLACFEKSNEFSSTYFFQLSNNSYNLLSKKNLEMLEEIHDMGHIVGLHFHMNGLTDIEKIKKEILNEIEIMNKKLSFKVDSFSVHRPSAEVLRANIKMDGILNAYQNEFFSFVENMDKEETEVKYLSDARHRWNYNLYPDSNTINNNPKVQILTHPYSWTKEGYDNLHNFRTLFQEKSNELLDTFNSECKHFKEIKDEL